MIFFPRVQVLIFLCEQLRETILDCCISSNGVQKFLVVLGVVDMCHFLLILHYFYPIQWNSSRNPGIFQQELPIRIAAAARFEFNCLVSLGAFSKWQVHSGECKGYLIFLLWFVISWIQWTHHLYRLIKLPYKNLLSLVCSKQKYFFLLRSLSYWLL